MTTVLIVGGYGAVGSDLCRILSTDSGIDLVVAGRDGEKASRLASELDAKSRVVDVNDPDSSAAGLEGIDLVVNCFVDVVEPSLNLPMAAIARGIYYLDLAAVPVEYVKSFLALDEKAKAGGATLVTSLGVNPGIPALLAISNGASFDRVDSVDIFFTMGAKLEGLSPLSLRGVDLMMRAEPLQWRENEWCKASPSGTKRLIGAPFEKQIYFGAAMITADLLDVPRIIGTKHLAFWSGMESTLQGMVFLFGMKLGCARTQERAQRFLRALRWLGRGDDTTNDISLELVFVGEKDGTSRRRLVSMHCSEEYATAIAPAILCRQIVRGLISDRGAFVAHQVTAIDDFVEQLRGADVSFAEHVEAIEE
ncbi:MAG: hypothetical protein GY856_53710 [bacterium]|nr:hypothetical protein [bacterium]